MLDKPDSYARPKATQQTASAPAAPPCAMVIFGAAGDLTKRLVVPALYELAHSGRLSDNFRLVGVDLAEKTAAQWIEGLTEMMRSFVGQSSAEFALDKLDDGTWGWLTGRMSYVQ